MTISAAVICKMVDLGLQASDIAELCRVIEDSQAEQAPKVDVAAEKRRAYDRERKRLKNHSTGIPPENSTGNSAEIPPETTHLARVRDITPNSEISGLAVVVEVSASDCATNDWPLGDPAKALIEAIASPRLDPSKSQGLITTAGRLAAWKREGASWQFDVLPVIQAALRKTGPPIGTWKYFDAAIAQSISDNRQALKIPEAHERHHPDQRPSPREESLRANYAGAMAAVNRRVSVVG